MEPIEGHERGTFLSTALPPPAERRLAAIVVAVSAAAFAALAPFARVPLPPAPGFIAVYQTAIVVNDVVTATLLLGQYGLVGSTAILALAIGYLLTAFLAAAHLLTFPGLFAPAGLLGGGPQTTAWLYMIWHASFPLAVIVYARLGGRRTGFSRGGVGVVAAGCVAAALGATVVAAVAMTAGHDALPAIMQGGRYTPFMLPVVASVWTLCLVALVVLWRRRPHSVLDLWVMVSVCAWLFDIALSAGLNAGRFDLGFYAGRTYGLVASTFVLFALLAENGRIHARLATTLGGLDELNRSLESRVATRTAELAASKDELREIASVGATAREQEKSRVARELHDELAQSLTMLRMDLGWIEARGPAGDETIAGKLAAMRKLVDDSVAATRRIASDLRPLVLDDLGLVPAVESLTEKFEERHGIACALAVSPPGLELADPDATAVFRIVQESLANVARHAGASRVDVDLRVEGGAIRLRVSDDGRGFDTALPRKDGSFGLVGLRERVHLVDGRIEIDSAPGRGTRIDVRIPLVPQ